jgi:hypothetical protein
MGGASCGANSHRRNIRDELRNMPELKSEYGYYAVLAAIVTLCGILYLRFNISGWI